MAPGCSAGVQVVTAVYASGARRGYCSQSHARAAGSGRPRRRCPACRATFDAVAAGNGRPASYCSPGCKSATERKLRRAVTELARDVAPDSGEQLAEQLARAELLLSVWGRRGEGAVIIVDELRERLWHGHAPPAPTAPPSREAVAALTARVCALRNASAAATRERKKREVEAARKAAAVADAKALGAHRVASQAWKADLLRGDGDESGA